MDLVPIAQRYGEVQLRTGTGAADGAVPRSLAQLGLEDERAYASRAFSRNLGLISPDEQQRLAQATIAIPGMGGVGGAHLVTATRMGVGRFRLADFDTFEPANINRQYGARVTTFGRSKLEVMMEEALSINPFLQIEPFDRGVGAATMDEFLRGADVVIDALDFFAFDVRRSLFNRARDLGVPVVTAGPLGFSSVMLVFDPRRGMSFDDYFDVHDGLSDNEKILRFAAGLSPQPTHWRYMDITKVDLDNRAGPSSSIACMLCAGIAVMEAVRIILGRPGLRPAPSFAQFDPYVGKYRKGRLWWGNRNPLQRAKLALIRRMLARSSKTIQS